MSVALNDEGLAFLRTKLKNGEYDGTDISAKMLQARALHDLVLTLGMRPGRERAANDVSREAAIMDAEIAALLRELPPQIPNEFGHLLTPHALWGMYVEDPELPNAKLTGIARERTHDDQ